MNHFVPEYNIPVHRSVSSTNFKEYNEIIAEKYRPIPYLSKHYNSRQWNSEYWWDRYDASPKFWPDVKPKHYHYTDPSYNYNFYYPALSRYPKYYRWSYTDIMNPSYWRRYRDPYYNQPLWFPYRPWVYESSDAQRATEMYRRKLITYDSLQKYWIQPSYNEKRFSDIAYSYRPIFWHSYPRSYSYFYDTCFA